MTAPLLEDTAHGSDAATDAIKGAVNGVKRSIEEYVPIEEYKDSVLPESKIPGTTLTAILPEDDKSADAWVPRDPKMIRLTGRHPFNSEPPPSDLMASYITSPELHYVRNHGAVPKVRHLKHPNPCFLLKLFFNCLSPYIS